MPRVRHSRGEVRAHQLARISLAALARISNPFSKRRSRFAVSSSSACPFSNRSKERSKAPRRPLAR